MWTLVYWKLCHYQTNLFYFAIQIRQDIVGPEDYMPTAEIAVPITVVIIVISVPITVLVIEVQNLRNRHPRQNYYYY